MADNFYGVTDVGKRRQNNEDTFIAAQSADGRYIIAAVIDGVGGYSGGEIAAELARVTILERLGKISGEIIPTMIDAFNTANEKIWEEKEAVKEHKSMACVITLAVVDITSNQFYYAHLGDTRLYLLRDGSLVKISRDQSFVGFLEDSGRLTEKEAMNHVKRNEIDKALGFKHKLSSTEDIETGQSPFLPGDMLLLCSDGLTDMVDKAAITEVMTTSKSLSTIGGGLIKAANDGGGNDNVTVVLVKNDKTTQQHAATKPVENATLPKPAAPVGIKKKPEPEPGETPEPPRKTGNGLVIILIILVLALAGLSIWQYLNYQATAVKDVAVVALPPQPKPLTAQEIKLQDAIDHAKGNLLVLNDTAYKGPIIISKPITIGRDSLHIKAKGNIVFQADSGFTGVAFVIDPKVKNISLDSVTFKNFSIGITENNQSVTLKNVRFVGCKIPVQNIFGLADSKFINGSTAPAQFKADSAPTKAATPSKPKKNN